MNERRTLTARELQQRKSAAEIRALCDNPAFLKFIFAFMGNAGIYSTNFSPGNPHVTSMKEGRRSLGLEVLDILRAARPDILQALEEVGGVLKITTSQQSPPSDEDDHERSEQ